MTNEQSARKTEKPLREFHPRKVNPSTQRADQSKSFSSQPTSAAQSIKPFTAQFIQIQNKLACFSLSYTPVQNQLFEQVNRAVLIPFSRTYPKILD
jgi:hypothetical protein